MSSEISDERFTVKFVGKSSRPLTAAFIEENRFKLVLRALNEQERDILPQNADELREFGVPNYYDNQRFGSNMHGQGFIAKALVQGRYGDVPAILTREMEARKRLAPGVSTPEIEKIAAAAASEGGAAKVCGAGGGGMVSVWAAPGRKEKVAAAIRAAGFKIAAFRLDLRGLEVD